MRNHTGFAATGARAVSVTVGRPAAVKVAGRHGCRFRRRGVLCRKPHCLGLFRPEKRAMAESVGTTLLGDRAGRCGFRLLVARHAGWWCASPRAISMRSLPRGGRRCCALLARWRLMACRTREAWPRFARRRRAPAARRGHGPRAVGAPGHRPLSHTARAVIGVGFIVCDDGRGTQRAARPKVRSRSRRCRGVDACCMERRERGSRHELQLSTASWDWQRGQPLWRSGGW